MKTLWKYSSMAAACVLSAPVWAQQGLDCDKSFAFRADVNNVMGNTLCGARVDTFLDASQNLRLSNTAYTSNSPVLVLARFSDVNIILRYSPNSPSFNYDFVELGIKGTAQGSTREQSQSQFVDLLKKSDIIGKLIHYQAMNSATSPLTGVGGVIPVAGASDFASGFDPASKLGGAARAPSDPGANNLIGVALGYSAYNLASSSDQVHSLTLPLSYTIRNSSDPRQQLSVNMPLTKVSVGAADSYHGGLGLAYRQPLSDQWTITPGAKFSVIASRDRATVATVTSTSLMSTYTVPLAGADLAIGNMIGFYKTGKFSSGDYAFNPDIALTMTRNGVLFSTSVPVFAYETTAEFSLIDTRYLGAAPFLSSTQELGVTIGSNRGGSNAHEFTRMGLSYIHGKGTSGMSFNVGFWF
ncbi:MAG: hypothetical protein V4582_19420 [Pseudomonadota bacterium]